MMAVVNSEYQDLLSDEKRAFAFLGTVMDDGSPQVTPVWFSVDGDEVLINSAKGRVKDKNMRARPQVALTIMDPGNPYRYIQIRGRVVEISTEGADEHIDALAVKYTGQPYANRTVGEVRTIYRIRPE
jgi:PPOX class probable F420-dependent enzyme